MHVDACFSQLRYFVRIHYMILRMDGRVRDAGPNTEGNEKFRIV